MKKYIFKIGVLTLLTVGVTSCSKDSLDPELSTSRDLDNDPIKSLTDLDYLINGMMKKMAVAPYYGRDYIIFNEARTDNAYSIGSSNRFVTVSEMNVKIGEAYPADTWLAIYQVILNANYVINATEIQDGKIAVEGNQAVIDDYRGQALVGRALGHFDLLKLYGQHYVDNQGGKDALTIPYVNKVPKNPNMIFEMTNVRNTLAEVRVKIYADLDEAILKITNTDKTKITKQAALGVKSRVALYFATYFPEDYQVALTSAELAIAEGGSVISAADFKGQFSGNIVNVNSVFELAFPSDDHLGNNGLHQIYNGTSYGDIVAQRNVDSLYVANDVRKTILGTVAGNLRNLGKYTAFADNVIIMRYEELLLNAAEAAIDIDPALSLDYVNQIRNKRNIDPLVSISKDDVLLERRKELIFEGFRYDDLMRLKRDVPHNPRLTETILYGDYRTAFPIPLSEINASGMEQNFGY
nr:RagB/SusD family nutrient uptake outer membrane protein [uncultured Flavobacterium sp.]